MESEVDEDSSDEEKEVVAPRGRRKSLYESPIVRTSPCEKSRMKALQAAAMQLVMEEEEEEEEGDEIDDGSCTCSSDSSSLSKADKEVEIEEMRARKTRNINEGPVLEHQLTNDKLMQLEEIFSEADEDGGGGLDMEEFRKAMRTQLGDKITDAELDKIFMKVDTNCDGTVDWDEYLTYMLLECKGQDTMNVKACQPFPKYVTTLKSPHRDSVIRILFMPSVRMESADTREGIYGRYLSVGQDGIVCVWNISMILMGTHRVQPEGKSVWVTDAAYLCGVQSVTISSTSRELYLYDVSGNRFQLTRRITNLNSCALALHFWNNGADKIQLMDGRIVKAILLWGESCGSLATVFFHTDPYSSPLCGKHEQKKVRSKITFQELLHDRIPGMSATYQPQLHGDLTRQVMLCPQLSSTISCCKDDETSMFVGGIGTKIISSYFKVKNGIDTFDYAPTLNVIVTGGYDGLVRIWNPYVSAKPVIKLDGHQFPILHVSIDTTLEKVVSMSENKEIRVHDLTTQTSVQTIFRKMIQGLGPRPVTAFFLNQGRNSLLFATNVLAMLEQQEEELVSPENFSHDRPVSHALYNPIFEQIVSVGTDSMVCVWSISSGEKVMQFKAHQVRRNGEMKDVEVTAMTFDPTYRRLITAAKNGDVRIWNFNNGACLRVLPKFDNFEVTSLVCPNRTIITAGWNKRVTQYVDSVDDDSVRRLKSYHRDDILSISHYRGSILASGSYDGYILVWSLSTGHLLFCLNGRLSNKQIEVATYFQSELTRDYTETHVPENERQLKSNGRTSASRNREKKMGKPHIVSILDSYKPCNSVQKLLFLEARESDAATATLFAACTDGEIQAWSLHHKGGLLGTFPGAHLEDTWVLTMVTDDENFVLVTGDTGGYVKVFDISNYCISAWENQEEDELYECEREQWHKQFPFVGWVKNIMTHENIGQKHWIRMYTQDRRDGPPLLNSFRAHLQTITCIDLVSGQQKPLILTSSFDRSVRLWTIEGQFVGIFGQKDLWDPRLTVQSWSKEIVVEMNSKGVYRNRKVLMPPDIQRVGSAATLMVLNGGRRPAWKLCSNVIKWLFTSLQPRPLALTHIPQRKILEQASSLKTLSDDAEKATDSILGSSYRRLTRHHPLPAILPPCFNGTTEVLSVYGSLQYHRLDKIVDLKIPESIKAIIDAKKKNSQKFVAATGMVQRKLKVMKNMGKRFSIRVMPAAHQQETSDLASHLHSEERCFV